MRNDYGRKTKREVEINGETQFPVDTHESRQAREKRRRAETAEISDSRHHRETPFAD